MLKVWGKRGANSNDISSHLSLLNVNPGPGNVAPPGPALFGNIFTHCVGDKDSNVVLPSFEEVCTLLDPSVPLKKFRCIFYI